VAVDTTVIDAATVRWLHHRLLASPDGIELHVITVAEPELVSAGSSLDHSRSLFEDALRESESQLSTRFPDGAVSGTVLWGFPADRLVRSAAGADLLVVETGRTGTGRGTDHNRLLARVAETCPCPLVVIPSGWDAEIERIVVGLAFTLSDETVMDFAARQALHQNRPVHLVHALDDAGTFARAVVSGMNGEKAVSDRAALLRQREEALRARLGGAAVTSATPHGAPATMLLNEAGPTSTLIVGARRETGAPSRLGSVNAKLLADTRCPLVVVPRDDID
jgi:nucleotide-binding universal stress UspA family protein